jgi:hypothetical protein
LLIDNCCYYHILGNKVYLGNTVVHIITVKTECRIVKLFPLKLEIINNKIIKLEIFLWFLEVIFNIIINLNVLFWIPTHANI